MSAAWVLYVLGVGTLLAMAATSLGWGARAVGLPSRWAWIGALVGIAALAVIAPRYEPVRLVAAAAVDTHQPIAIRPSTHAGFVERLRDASAVVAERATSIVSSIDRHLPTVAARVLLAAWFAASGLLLALFAIVHLRLARVRSGWDVQRVYDVEIRITPATGPAVLGLLRPEIVVPRSLLERSDDEQRLILEHEREHLAARDHLLLAAAWLVAIALPWHPAVWFLLGRLRLAIELDCDARLLRGGVPARRYGALLLDMAAQGEGTRIGALALADGPSHLERRILAMGAPRRRFAKTWGAAVITLGAALTFVACEAKIPTAADISAMDVASVQRSASEAGFMRTPSGDRTDYFINGVKASAEQARAIETTKIGSIEVVKSELANGRDTVIVTTADRMPADQRGMKMRGSVGSAAQPMEMKRSADSTSVRLDANGMRLRTGAQPLFIIDDQQSTSSALAALRPEQIESIAIYKGDAVRGLSSDPKAKNGVIYVTTKGARKAQGSR